MDPGPKPHVGGPIKNGCPTVDIVGQKAARVGDTAQCQSPAPDTISTGSKSVFIGGAPAARLGDSTSHGGRIVVGAPTVFIGDEPGSILSLIDPMEQALQQPLLSPIDLIGFGAFAFKGLAKLAVAITSKGLAKLLARRATGEVVRVSTRKAKKIAARLRALADDVPGRLQRRARKHLQVDEGGWPGRYSRFPSGTKLDKAVRDGLRRVDEKHIQVLHDKGYLIRVPVKGLPKDEVLEVIISTDYQRIYHVMPRKLP